MRISPTRKGAALHDEASRDPDFELLPFLFLSGSDDPSFALERKERGGVDFVRKPIREHELVATASGAVATYLRLQRLSLLDESTGVLNRRGARAAFRECHGSDGSSRSFSRDVRHRPLRVRERQARKHGGGTGSSPPWPGC